jgi:hypothetical protein
MELCECSPVLGFALLIVVLTLVCPRNSKIPRQAIKVALVLLLGSLLSLNVIAETTVRTQPRAPVPVRVSRELLFAFQTY